MRFLCLMIALLLAGAWLPAWSQSAPAFTLPDRSGETVTLDDLRGKVVYLDFWASWCPPCKVSFPWMGRMHQQYADEGLAVVAVNLDTQRSKARKFLEENPAPFTVLFDPEGKVAERYQLKGMPTSLLIGREGEVLWRHTGFRKEESQDYAQRIREALNR